jgi:hypothetical protein
LAYCHDLVGHELSVTGEPAAALAAYGKALAIRQKLADANPNAAEPQPKRMSKNGVLPPKWCCLDTQLGAERHEDAFAFHYQVYQPYRRQALLF